VATQQGETASQMNNRTDPILIARQAAPRINVMTHTRETPLTGGDDIKEVTPDAAHRTH
jgi:hypothetical protein